MLSTFIAVNLSVLAAREKSDEVLQKKISEQHQQQQQDIKRAGALSAVSAGEIDIKAPSDNRSTNFV